MISRKIAFSSLLLLASSVPALAGPATFYVGNDVNSGPNQGHVTFLFSHVNHFHRLGPVGGAPGRVPEGSVGGSVYLQPGEGAFAGRFASGPYHLEGNLTSEFSDFEIRPISSLLGFPPDSPESILINGGLRYLGSLEGTNLAMELVSISPGLKVADAATGADVASNPGDRRILGEGTTFAPFTPKFYTDLDAKPGTSYSATFRLIDLNGLVPESGLFTYELQTAPEPGTFAAAGLGVVAAAIAARRRARTRA